jgi:uncharacterized protein (DUF488 family)
MTAMSPLPVVWTIGHSNHGFETLCGLLRRQDIDYVLDVRSYPYSRFAPHFNRERLRPALDAAGFKYRFVGIALGGRPQRDEQFDAEGRALYDAMAREPAFTDTIDQVLRGARQRRLALMCSCGQPHDCHRRLLVGKVLCERGADLCHILPDGTALNETCVRLPGADDADRLFGHDDPPWRSTRPVEHKSRLNSSPGD